MKYLRNFELFREAADPIVKPTPTTTPTTTPRPTRPGVVPTERPSEEDAPLASSDDVINRFKDIYKELSEDERDEINSYFEK